MSVKDKLLECFKSNEELTLFDLAASLGRLKREVANLLVDLQSEGKIIRHRNHRKERLHSYSRTNHE